MANPTSQVPTDFTFWTDVNVYWPYNPANTSDTVYTGEMIGMLYSTGYSNHFDDSAPMLFLGSKTQITNRFQTDTPTTDFKLRVIRPRLFEMPLASGTTSIPTAIGQGAYAVDSGHVQVGNSGLVNSNLAGMIVDIGRSAATGGSTGGILSLTGATSVIIAPPTYGALTGLIAVGPAGVPSATTTGGNAPSMTVNAGAGGNATAIGNGGVGGSIVLTPGAGGTSATATAGVPGAIVHAGPVRSPFSGGTQTLAASSTITLPTGGVNVFVTNTAATASIVLTPGRFDGDSIKIVNLGTNTVTFAASGTSNVAAGTGASIAANASLAEVWSSVKSLWY